MLGVDAASKGAVIVKLPPNYPGGIYRLYNGCTMFQLQCSSRCSALYICTI